MPRATTESRRRNCHRLIEQHLPLVQPHRVPGGGALPPPRGPRRAGPGRRPRSGRGGPPLRRVPRACRSTASPRSASGAPSSTPSGPPTGPPARCARLARRLEGVEQRLATELGRVPNVRRDGRGARHDPRRAEPPAGPHVPLGRPRPRARGERRHRRGPHPGRRALPTAAPSSRSRSSRPASCTPTCVTPCTCCPSATAW